MKFLKKPILVKKNEGGATDIRAKKGLPPKTGSRASASTAATSEKPKR
jgi:hypothetical protein